jgi:hypothetical protein
MAPSVSRLLDHLDADDVVAPELPDAVLLVEEHHAVDDVVREVLGVRDGLQLDSRVGELVVVSDVAELDERDRHVLVGELCGQAFAGLLVLGRLGVDDSQGSLRVLALVGGQVGVRDLTQRGGEHRVRRGRRRGAEDDCGQSRDQRSAKNHVKPPDRSLS